jgi:lipopolysaccharide transport system permease protein
MIPAATPPVTIVQPSRGWWVFPIGEAWRFRDLFLLLVRRDVALRYKQTVLGLIWVVLQPLLASTIFAVIFGRLARIPSDGVPYLPFVFAALVPWTLFSQGVQRAGVSVIGDANLVGKVYFPRVLLPAASVGAVLADVLVALGTLAVVAAVSGVAFTPRLLALPLALLLTLGLTLGVGLLVAALNVYYRDFVHAMPFVLQIGLYASPVVYSSRLVPERWRAFFGINPLVGVIDFFRWLWLPTGGFPWPSVVASTLVSALLLFAGLLVFHRIERRFADVI